MAGRYHIYIIGNAYNCTVTAACTTEINQHFWYEIYLKYTILYSRKHSGEIPQLNTIKLSSRTLGLNTAELLEGSQRYIMSAEALRSCSDKESIFTDIKAAPPVEMSAL